MLRKAVRAWGVAVLSSVASAYPSILAQAQALRADTAEDDAASMGDKLSSLWGQQSARLQPEVTRIADKLQSNHYSKTTTSLQAAIGVDVMSAEPWLQGELAAYARENAKLIKSIGTQAAERIEVLTLNAAKKGSSMKDLRAELVALLQTTEKRAALIARDQIGKLNGQLTRLRHEGAGIGEYRWRGSLDRRERKAHVMREGKKFAYASPPPDGNPGEPIQCRCHPEPVMDEFDDLLAEAKMPPKASDYKAEPLKSLVPQQEVPSPYAPQPAKTWVEKQAEVEAQLQAEFAAKAAKLAAEEAAAKLAAEAAIAEAQLAAAEAQAAKNAEWARNKFQNEQNEIAFQEAQAAKVAAAKEPGVVSFEVVGGEESASHKVASEWAHKEFAEQIAQRTKEEVKAAGSYQGANYSYVNAYLRTGKPFEGFGHTKEKWDAVIENVDKLIQRHQLSVDTKVYRGIKGFDAAVGETISDLAYTSTSLSREVAESFAGKQGVVAEIVLPKGTKAAFVQPYTDAELEILLERGTRFKVVARWEENGVQRVKLEILEGLEESIVGQPVAPPIQLPVKKLTPLEWQELNVSNPAAATKYMKTLSQEEALAILDPGPKVAAPKPDPASKFAPNKKIGQSGKTWGEYEAMSAEEKQAFEQGLAVQAKKNVEEWKLAKGGVTPSTEASAPIAPLKDLEQEVKAALKKKLPGTSLTFDYWLTLSQTKQVEAMQGTSLVQWKKFKATLEDLEAKGAIHKDPLTGKWLKGAPTAKVSTEKQYGLYKLTAKEIDEIPIDKKSEFFQSLSQAEKDELKAEWKAKGLGPFAPAPVPVATPKVSAAKSIQMAQAAGEPAYKSWTPKGPSYFGFVEEDFLDKPKEWKLEFLKSMAEGGHKSSANELAKALKLEFNAYDVNAAPKPVVPTSPVAAGSPKDVIANGKAAGIQPKKWGPNGQEYYGLTVSQIAAKPKEWQMDFIKALKAGGSYSEESGAKVLQESLGISFPPEPLPGIKVPPPLPATAKQIKGSHELDAWAKGKYVDWTSATPSQRSALRHYQGDGYTPMNTQLRNKNVTTEQKKIKDLDSYMKLNRTKEELVSYRGVQSREFKKYLMDLLAKGEDFTDEGYGSSSPVESVGRNWSANNLVIEIVVPEGTPSVHFNTFGSNSRYPNEQEILMPRGCRYKLDGMYHKDGIDYMRMVVVGNALD